MENNENIRITGGFGPFNLAYSIGLVMVLLRAAGIITVDWGSVVSYFMFLAFATAFIFTIVAVIALIGGNHRE
ncbi:hypothetical protein [Lacticaseibacillus suihuaensis]